LMIMENRPCRAWVRRAPLLVPVNRIDTLRCASLMLIHVPSSFSPQKRVNCRPMRLASSWLKWPAPLEDFELGSRCSGGAFSQPFTRALGESVFFRPACIQPARAKHRCSKPSFLITLMHGCLYHHGSRRHARPSTTSFPPGLVNDSH